MAQMACLILFNKLSSNYYTLIGVVVLFSY